MAIREADRLAVEEFTRPQLYGEGTHSAWLRRRGQEGLLAGHSGGWRLLQRAEGFELAQELVHRLVRLEGGWKVTQSGSGGT